MITLRKEGTKNNFRILRVFPLWYYKIITYYPLLVLCYTSYMLGA